ncbi:alpha/beta hydrolase [Microbulbifer aggregans]|uniref:alpha/beta hydrolase n=1 Tax=Microbulbifer aggregans TaxID=1769779 RepID=UPI001CFE1DC4|nr:alpha/beta hydrolase-fold protein [Microbulbifer aggregans]
MKKQRILLSLLIALATFTLACTPDRQLPTDSEYTPLDYLPALRGDYFRLESEIVGRPYHIYVRYPEGYDASSPQNYPVIYLLDGDSLFPILAANHLFLTYDDKLPEAIVVGIAYGGFKPEINRRSFDFSTSSGEDNLERGGAANFLAFLEQELIPRVEKRYRADPLQRVLFGQSRGGYMVLYTAMQKPDLFRGLVASNPTLNPGREQFFATPAPATRDDLTLVVTSGTHDIPGLRADAAAWRDHWLQQESTPWKIAFNTTKAGTHAANSPDSYRFGLRAIFDHVTKE